MRDLRARRRDEVVEEPGGDVLLPGVSSASAPSRCSSTMCCAPPRRSSVSTPQRVGADRALLVPEALHDELEVRRLDPRAVLRALDRPEPSERRLDLPGADLVEHALDEVRLDGDGSSPVSSAKRSTGRSIAARAAGRSSRSRRSVFANRPGIRPVKRSSFASESSRSETRTLMRCGLGQQRRQRLGEGPGLRRRRGRGSTPPPGRGSR